jgi:hypothetical protein
VNDYADAAERHFFSALALQAEHPATASHCWGIAAECALKAIMCGMRPQPKSVSGNHLGTKLLAEFANHQTVQSHPSRVTHVQRSSSGFHAWTVHQRYLKRGDAHFARATLAAEEVSARSLVGLMQMIQKGLA